MKIPILRLSYRKKDIEFIKKGIEAVLKSGYLTMSGNVAKLEKLFANFVGTKYAVGVNSGTSSLEIILRSISVEGRTVIVPSNTFMATPLAVIHAGGQVIFADCEKENLQLDPNDLKKKIRPDTKAVIVVHIGGIISPQWKKIEAICKEYKLFLIEDAAHAHGATISNRSAGNLGVAASFSFYPTKVLTTAEGGIISTNREEIYKKALVLREHGKADQRFNIHTELGYNWRFSELHAVLGLEQMRRANWILQQRRKIAQWYDQNLVGLKGINLLKIPANVQSSYYKYIVFLPQQINRERLKTLLQKEFNIELPGEVYAYPCHRQPVFEKYPYWIVKHRDDQFPNTEYVCSHHLCLPLYPGLKEQELKYIVSSLKKVLA